MPWFPIAQDTDDSPLAVFVTRAMGVSRRPSETLLASGVKIDAFQTEGRRGQYELTLGCLPPLAAVDQLILVHDTLKRIFGRHGLMATMSPRPVQSRRQSTGQHTHLSINPPEMEDHFLAGLLRRLPEMCAFCLPYQISYERVQPYLAGDLVAWARRTAWSRFARSRPATGGAMYRRHG